jgi:AraC-like DNA-binding protein
MRTRTLDERRLLYLRARLIVARHYRRELTLATLARALSCSPRHLQRAYAQFGQTTFREDLLARRVAAAAALLDRYPLLAVREVARLVGYRDARHFSEVFHRRLGMTPRSYRHRRAGAALRRPTWPAPAPAARRPAA